MNSNSRMNIQVALLVVIYNKQLANSETLRSLVDLGPFDVQLLVINNGPNYIEQDDFFLMLKSKFPSLTLKNEIQNKPLSWVYNDFINAYESDRYVILDDDTVVTREYFSQLVFNTERYDLGLPKIHSHSDHKQYFPFFKGKFSEFERGQITGDGNFSVTSAIVISAQLIQRIKKKFKTVFDEHFALYCIDNTFWYRVQTIAKEKSVTYLSNVVLIHNLSSVSSESWPEWRKREALIANILPLRYYATNGLRQIIKRVIKAVLVGKLKEGYFIGKIYIEGKHPRCKQIRYRIST